MEVRVSRASAVVVQRVPATAVNWFMEWQNSVTAVAGAFTGYQGTDVYPPAKNQGDEWVVAIHFADDQSLQQWLDSPMREQWLKKLRAKLGEFTLKTMLGGFSSWFVGMARTQEEMPPSWKMVMAVLVGLYPLAMLQTFNRPNFAPLGLAVSMLLDCAVSVSLLQWVVMPAVTTVLGSWLKANTSRDRARSIGGLCLIILLLVSVAILFRQVTG